MVTNAVSDYNQLLENVNEAKEAEKNLTIVRRFSRRQIRDLREVNEDEKLKILKKKLKQKSSAYISDRESVETTETSVT